MGESSWYIRRLEKAGRKREKRIEKFRGKLEKHEAAHKAGKLTRAQLQIRKKEIESKIRVAQASLHKYQGLVRKERRKLETGEDD